jgi:hypothetical protein
MSPRRTPRSFSLALWAVWAAALPALDVGAQTIEVNGSTLTVKELAGVGRLPANLRDRHGETFGSISGLVADPSRWQRRADGSYTGTFYAAPDRGFNLAGTIDYAPRLNRLDFRFTPAPANAGGLPQDQVRLVLTNSTRLFETLDGTVRPLSGLDPVPGGVAAGGARVVPGWPELPQAFNGKLSLDAEGIVILSDGSRLVSDEYGPSIYRFSRAGRLIGALPVADSVRPLRNGVTDYSSNNPATGQPAPVPANPTYGRSNNQGFEGLSLTPDGRTLFVALQSAARQDGASTSASRRDHTRLYTYDVSDPDAIVLTGEYVVQLPKFQQGSSTLVAAQSEILALSPTQLLILPRDSNGFLVGTQQSLLRRVDLVDIAAATNVLGLPVEANIAPGGVLDPSITPALYTPWLDINDNAQLARFGLVNGVVDGLVNLSEKWEGLALLPALDPDHPDDHFLFVANDNDFATTDGLQAGAAYDAGWDNPTTFLVWRVGVRLGPVSDARPAAGAR